MHGDPDDIDYIQSMLRELRVQAAAGRHDMLAYLIEMAYVEASDLVRKRYSDNDRERSTARPLGRSDGERE